MGDGDGDEESVQCALVEFAKGVKARKWELALGSSYTVGRPGGGADIEIDHASLSRRHCSLAVTREEGAAGGALMLVALDPGSTNGTFVDKCRLEKGVGFKRRISELKHVSFGECPNGYRVLVRNDVKAAFTEGREKAAAIAFESPSSETTNCSQSRSQEVASQKDRSKQMKLELERERRRKAEAVGEKEETKSRKRRGSWRTADPGSFGRSAAKLKGDADAVNIEWPEDWR